MGGRGRTRTQRKHFKQSRENVWKRTKSEPSADNNNNDNDKPAWQPFATQNPAFDEYYKEQGIVSPEEWDSFMEVLRKPLPAAFRINSSSQFCSDIRVQLENDFMKSLQAEVTDGEAEPIRPLPWYPENLAWHSNFSRMQLRKNQTLERFHEFLKLENEIGNITRQEAVSMVPPLFLDVLPFHFVLDMCAAPGSKTFQLLEIIHQSTKAGSLPDGMVVANDLDVQRCNLLIHQTKRMCTANLIVTNHEAQHFPGCRSNRKCSSSSESAIRFQMSISQLIFDRVLCDVPCSGDGTLRKAPDIWRKWNAGLGNGIHCLQVQIAMRGLSLLKVGGRMVYSTCSMNPVENEAVVAEILRKCGGSLELIDVSCELPRLVRRPGLKKWKVRDKGTWFVSFKDVPKYRRSVIVPSMFPSGRRYLEQTENNHDTELGEKDENGCSGNSEDGFEPVKDPVALADELDDEVCTFPLERCMRIMPHDQNSGAFFIAVFHKLSPLPAMQENSSCLQGDNKPFVKPPNQILEDSNGVEVISGVGTDEKFSEAASVADLIENERDDEPYVKPLNQILEDSNGVGVFSGAGTDEKFSEAASEADLIDTESGGAAAEPPLCSTCDEPNSENAQAPDHMETDPRKAGGKRKLQKQGKWKGVDPVVFFKDEAIINSIKSFYGIDDSFPLNGHLVTRNSDTNHVKRIYYISKSVKDVLELNFSVGQQLKITSIGMKMFERQTSREGSSTPCAFRISSEGLPLILPCITKQILYASLVDFKHLLQYKSIKFSDFVDAEFGQKASNLMLGCCVIVLRKGSGSSLDHTHVDESTIAIGCWKGRGSLTVMVTGIDCQELLERLVIRIEAENSPLVPEGKSCIEADKVQDMKGIENLEDIESDKLATES